MQPIQQAFEPVSICFASDDNYAPYLKVAIYSLLCNRNRERSYDIIILHKKPQPLVIRSVFFDDTPAP